MCLGSRVCRMHGLMCVTASMSDEDKADPLGMRRAVKGAMNSGNHRAFCLVLQRYDSFVRAGTLDRGRAALHASAMKFPCNDKDHTLMWHVIKHHVCSFFTPEGGSSCLHVLLSWGTCPHVVTRNFCFPSQRYSTPYLYRDRLCQRDLDLLLASGCQPADIVGDDYMETVLGDQEAVTVRNELRVCQWFRWHRSHRKRYWIALLVFS